MSRCLNCDSAVSDHWASAEDIEYRTSTDKWEYRRCQSCDVVFLPSPPIDRLDEMHPPNYYSFRDEGVSVIDRVKSWLDQRMLRRFCAWIVGDEIALLDVGGGGGYLASSARKAEPR